MKKYYYKNEIGDVYTNDPNVYDTNTKPITACYSGRFYRHGIDNDQESTYNYGNHSPWFCMKDGKYPIYYLSDKNQHFNDEKFKGFRKIFDFTVSSLSGQYFLNPSASTSPTNVYTNYRVPFTTPYLQKLDWIVDDENLFEENVNIHSATKLQWKMKTDLITEFRTYTQGPNSYNGDTDGFVLKISMRGSQAIKNNVNGFDVPNGNDILTLSYMDFTNVTPTVIWSAHSMNDLTIHGEENKPGNFIINVPPHFTLEKSKFPAGTTGIKIKVDGLFLHSNFIKNSYYFPDDAYVNNTATFNAGIKSTNCLGLIYQSNDRTEWHWNNDNQYTPSIDYLNNNYTATFDYVPNGVGNKLKNKSSVKTTDRTDCLNYWYYPEKQELTNPSFWNNILVYSANTNNTDLYLFKRKTDVTDSGYMYMSEGSTASWVDTFIITKVDDAYHISNSNFLTANNKMTNMDGEVVDFSANDRFIIYSSPGALEADYYKPYYKCDTYNYWEGVTSTSNDQHLSALGSINNSVTSYIAEARNGWKWNPTGNAPSRYDFTANNYNFSNCTMEYTIPISEVTSQYLHISYPITTVNCGPYGSQNKGLVLEYSLTYEYVK